MKYTTDHPISRRCGQARPSLTDRDVPEGIEERLALPEAPGTPAVMDRALHVSSLLATTGAHRRAKPADLVIAAAAEAARLVVLHYDDDYDRIAAVTTSRWNGLPPKAPSPAELRDRRPTESLRPTPRRPELTGCGSAGSVLPVVACPLPRGDHGAR